MDKFRGNGDASEIGLTSSREGGEGERGGRRRKAWNGWHTVTTRTAWNGRKGKVKRRCLRCARGLARVGRTLRRQFVIRRRAAVTTRHTFLLCK